MKEVSENVLYDSKNLVVTHFRKSLPRVNTTVVPVTETESQDK